MQATKFVEQGDLLIDILAVDRLTGEELGVQAIKRATLAKYYHEQRVVGAKNGLTKVQF